MSMIYFKVPVDEIEGVQSRSYEQLKEDLSHYPNGVVGVEMTSDGLMQHYLYQLDTI